jgi:hypothetical protein
VASKERADDAMRETSLGTDEEAAITDRMLHRIEQVKHNQKVERLALI